MIVGRTGCGKTTFMQNLALNIFFGKIKKAEWVSYIPLTAKREMEIQSNFSCEVKFYYPRSVEELDDLLEKFKQKSRSEEEATSDSQSAKNVNVFGEKSNRDRLIVLDDVSSLADESKKFASFLTVARKYSYNCIYIFHLIHPEKTAWRTILSQTNIYNSFPATVPFTNVKKILEGACIKKTSKYIPQSAFGLVDYLLNSLTGMNRSV